MSRFFVVAGSVLAGLAVAAGALGAHALGDRLDPERLEVFETAARYQMYHALALLAVAWLVAQVRHKLPVVAGYFFIAGIFLFSGSLYVLALADMRWLGAVAPLGGAAFLAGWMLLALTGLKSRTRTVAQDSRPS